MISRPTNETNRTESHHLLGFHDSKRRQIGVRVVEWEVDYVDAGPGQSGYAFPVGHYFVACVSTTRAGVDYGASQERKHCRTVGERAAYVLKRLNGAQQRYAKQARDFCGIFRNKDGAK